MLPCKEYNYYKWFIWLKSQQHFPFFLFHLGSATTWHNISTGTTWRDPGKPKTHQRLTDELGKTNRRPEHQLTPRYHQIKSPYEIARVEPARTNYSNIKISYLFLAFQRRIFNDRLEFVLINSVLQCFQECRTFLPKQCYRVRVFSIFKLFYNKNIKILNVFSTCKIHSNKSFPCLHHLICSWVTVC